MHPVAAALTVALSLALAACEPPDAAEARPVSAPETISAPDFIPPPLPPAVQATASKLMQIGETGGYRDMADLADKTPNFRSNDGGVSHKAYWYLKLRTGDWPMEHMRLALSEPPARLDTAQGPIYVWPWVAALAPIDITSEAAREMDRMAGEGAADAMRSGQRWPGYVLGIAEDGTWLFFYSGSG
jgi:hypothetical protein